METPFLAVASPVPKAEDLDSRAVSKAEDLDSRTVPKAEDLDSSAVLVPKDT